MHRKRIRITTGFMVLGLAGGGFAADIVKTNNTDALTAASSWIGGTAPGVADIAVWDAIVTTTNSVALGADASWNGIRIANPGGPVTISAGNVLTLGAGGVDLSGATQNLTADCGLGLGVAQTWNVASGRTLTAGGVVDGAGALAKNGAGTLTLGAANIHTGGTAVNAGTLKIGNAGALGAPAGAELVTVNNGGALDLAGVSISAQGKPVVISGAGVSGTFGAIGNSGAALVSIGLGSVRLGGDATIGSAGNRFDVLTSLDGGGFALTKAGANMIAMKGAVTNLASLTVNAGRWGAENNRALGTGPVTVNAGATLELYQAPGVVLAFTNSLALNGGTVDCPNGGPHEWNGAVALSGGNTFTGASRLDVNGPLTGSGTLGKTGAGTLMLSTGTYTPSDVTINGGTLILGGTLATTLTGNINVGNGTASTLNITNTAAVTVGNAFLLGNPAGVSGTVNQSAGTTVTFNGTADGFRIAHYAGETSTYNLLGGTLNIANGSNLRVGWDGTGIFSMSGGTLNAAGAGIFVGRSLTGALNLSGGTVNAGAINVAPGGGSGSTFSITSNAVVNVGTFHVGEANGKAGSGTQSGASAVTVSNQFRLGHWPNETSTYTLNGGTLALTGTGGAAPEYNGILYIGIDGTGVFNHNGGAITALGMVLDNRGDTAGTDAYTLTGGSLTLGASGLGGNASSLVSLGGGTVKASASWTGTRPITLTGTNGNTVFDPQGNTITLTGALTGAGGLVKTGAGMLVLNGGANTFTGGTVVTGGVLRVLGNATANRLANGSSVTVHNGARFEFGQLNALPLAADAVDFTIQNGGLLDFTNVVGAAGYHAHCGNLTLAGGAVRGRLNADGYNGENFVLLGNVAVTGTVASTFNLQAAARGGMGLAAGVHTLTVADVTGDTNVDCNVTGEIQNVGGLLKTGSGTLRLNSATTFTGGATVDAGTLQLNFSGPAGTLIGAVTVNTNASLESLAWDSFGYNGTGISTLNINGGRVFHSANANLTLGRIAINLTGGLLQTTNLPNSRLDFLDDGVTVTTLASSNTSTIAGPILLRAVQTVTRFTVADGEAADDLLLTGPLMIETAGHGLAKYGPGTLTLAAASAHSGRTVIQAGALRLRDTAALSASSPLALGPGAVLDVSARTDGTLALGGTQVLTGAGTVTGHVVTATGAQLLPGTNAIAGTLTVAGDLAVTNACTLGFDLAPRAGIGGGTNDLLRVAGHLALRGKSTILAQFPRGAPATIPSTYTLITYGSLSGGLANLTLQARGGVLGLDTNSHAVTVSFSTPDAGPGALVWRGDGVTNAWDVGGATNWVLNATPDRFFDFDRVTFDDTGTNLPAVQLAGTLRPAAVTVNATRDYTLTGGSIAGSGGVTKSGSGALTLQPGNPGDNTYTGSTTVNGGTLNLAGHNTAGSVVGSGPLQVNTGALCVALSDNALGSYTTPVLASLFVNGGTYQVGAYHHANRITFSGGTVGARPGVAQLDGLDLNTWSGQAPQVSVLANPHTATLASRITLRAATALDVADGTNATDLALSGVMVGTAALTKTGAGRAVLTGSSSQTGATTVNGGTLAILGAGQLYSTLGWASQTFSVNNATVEIDGWNGAEQLGQNSYAAGNLVLNNGRIHFTGPSNAAANPTDAGNGRAFTIGAGGATLEVADAGATWSICRYNTPDAYPLASAGGLLTLTGAGNGVLYKVIPGAGGVTKAGAGTWTLAGTNTYAGATRAEAGTLLATGPLASTAVTVANGATFGGASTLAGTLTVETGGRLSVGAAAGAIGLLRVSNTVTLQEGATCSWEGSADSADLLDVTGDINLPAVLNLAVTLTDNQMPDSAVVCRWSGTNTGASDLRQWVIPGSFRAAVMGNEVRLTRSSGLVLILR